MLGIWTWDCIIIGADESTELWRRPQRSRKLNVSWVLKRINWVIDWLTECDRSQRFAVRIQSLAIFINCQLYWKDENKEKKRGRKWHISLKWWVFFSIEKDKRSLKIAYTYQRLRSHTCQWWKRGLAIMTSETRLGFFWSQRFLHKSSPNVCWFLDF